VTAVITGIGVVAPNGLGVEDYWAATLAGMSGLGPLTRFDATGYPTKVVGEVPGFTATDHLTSRMAIQTDRWTQMALYASDSALLDAGLDAAGREDFDEYEMAVVTASSSAGNEFGQRELGRLWSTGPEHVTAYQSIAWFYAATTGQISIRNGMRGPCGVLASEQAGGLDALAHARRVLGSGARLVVTGGTEAPLSPYAVVCLQSTGALSPSADPAAAYLPFDDRAGGYVPGEGGAMMVLEDDASAKARGVRGYGIVAGCASTFDPRPGSGKPPNLGRAAELAMADAGVEAGDVDVVFADATGIPALDEREAEAIVALFGHRAVPVTAPKTMTGRLIAGGAALDVVTAVLAIRDGVIPPATNIRPAERYGLDLVVGRARPAEVRTALVLARGEGGFNSAAVLTKVPR